MTFFQHVNFFPKTEIFTKLTLIHLGEKVHPRKVLIRHSLHPAGSLQRIQESGGKTTVWMCKTPVNLWDKLPTSTGDRRTSEASTVWILEDTHQTLLHTTSLPLPSLLLHPFPAHKTRQQVKGDGKILPEIWWNSGNQNQEN